MPLQEDQRAMLQLLCARGQSYEDISGLLGVPTGEVRNRAREALTEIGGADPDAEVGLTDYLLGQADPIGRADAIRFLQGDPEALELARRIQDGLAEVAPTAKQPNLPEPRSRRRRAALPAGTDASASERARPPAEGDGNVPAASSAGSGKRTWLIAGLAAGGLAALVAILLISGAFSGSGDEPSASTESGVDDPGAGTNITAVPLEPTSGSGVAGRATFGLIENEQLFIDTEVQGLDPELGDERSYLVWLMVGDDAGYPVDQIPPDENGAFSGRLTVPTSIAVAVGNQARSVRVSSTSVEALQEEIRRAAETEVPVLPFVGAELASGEIPLVRNPSDRGDGEGER